MPKFFFHVHDGAASVQDDVGRDLPDLETAQREAIADIADVMAQDFVMLDKKWATWSLQICDEEGKVLTEIPFVKN